MRAATLRQVESALEHISAAAPKLLEAARWTWPLAYARGSGQPVPRVAGGDVARPVEAALGSEGTPEWQVRVELERAGVFIHQAVVHLYGAGACMARAREAAGLALPPEWGAQAASKASRSSAAPATSSPARRTTSKASP